MRASFLILALASAFALNGCSQCSNPSAEQAPAETAPAATPAEQPATDPAGGATAPADGAAAPAEVPPEGATGTTGQ